MRDMKNAPPMKEKPRLKRAAVKDRMEEPKMTKRFVSVMLAVLTMMLCVFVPAALAGEEGPNAHAGYYYVKTGNGKGLNVRDNPNGKVVGSLKYGTRVYVDAFSDSEWALITYRYDNGHGKGDYAAYVSTRFLVRDNPGKYRSAFSAAASPASAEKQVASPYTVVSCPVRASGWVNLRMAPSTDAKVLEKCYSGKTLTVLAEMKGWFRVQDPANGMIGYISSRYVSRV